MKTKYMKLLKEDNESYQLKFRNDTYQVYYSVSELISKLEYEECTINCNYSCDDDVPFEKFLSLKGEDIVDNLEMYVAPDGKGLTVLNQYINVDYASTKIGHKDSKLFIQIGFSFDWSTWNGDIELKQYASFLSKSLNKYTRVKKSLSFIEESVQWVQCLFEFDAKEFIIDCIYEVNKIIDSAHRSIMLSYKQSQEIDASQITRCIEFEPQYYQAGLGILNYFATVVREKYPNKKVKVKIEQSGYSVSMIVETEDGDKEVIEKLLHDYNLVVIGQKEPETFLDTPLQIIELKQELRLAHTRIETQKELIEYRDKAFISLENLFQQVLKQNSTFHLNVSPNINIDMNQTTQVGVSNDILELSGLLKNIIDNCDDNVLKGYIKSVNDAVQNIKGLDEKELRKDLSSLSKIKTFFDEANKTGSSLNTFLNTVTNGYDSLKIIGKKYNAIAEWCGAPQIPLAFL